jgi:DNA-binding beta-propeller fold protein YncE
MPHPKRFGVMIIGILAAVTACSGSNALAQASYPPPNDGPDPYQTVLHWAQLPNGRTWGSTAGVAPGPHGNIWTYDRCGANSCDGSTLDPILEFDPSGKLLKSFGAGTLLMPHGFYVDRQGNVWITDAAKKEGKGLQVFKFSPDGKLLMTLGKSGVEGDGNDVFSQPTGVVVAKNGDIYVSDGHTPTCGNSRVMVFDKSGKFLRNIGHKGTGDGELMCPHAVALDSKGRLFVADRSNNRVVIFDPNGNFVAAWKQFGRPSGIFIDQHDMLYVSDSESRDTFNQQNGGYGYNPGSHRGIRIGSVKDGKVIAYLPDPMPTAGTSDAEGVAADQKGNVYGAEVGPKDLKKYVKKS